jgi:hypothetical protein
VTVGVFGRLETLGEAAMAARQMAYSFGDARDDDREIFARGMLELAAALDRFARQAERSGWRGPVAELFPVERTVMP